MSTSIEWTDETWNPTTGCTKVSPGCAHCYIERTPAFRIAGRKFLAGATDLRLHAGRLEHPLHWRKPRRVFVNSLSDLFHDAVPDAFIDRVFAVMGLAPRHTFQVLTKRPARMRAYIASRNGWGCGVWFAAHEIKPPAPPQHWYHAARTFTWPLPNVWLGVSVENQHFADERIPLLLETPAAVRFISAEPLLEAVDFSTHLGIAANHDDLKGWLNWVIVGGESGPGARPFDLRWARAILGQCRAARVPCFVKQLGARPTGRCTTECGFDHDMKFTDRKGGDPAEWPDDLRVREFPEARA